MTIVNYLLNVTYNYEFQNTLMADVILWWMDFYPIIYSLFVVNGAFYPDCDEGRTLLTLFVPLIITNGSYLFVLCSAIIISSFLY